MDLALADASNDATVRGRQLGCESLPPNFVDIQAAADVLANYATLRNQIVQKINDIEYIQLHPEEFVNVAGFPLQDNLQKLITALNQLKQNASQCVNSIKDCKFANVEIPTVNLPQRIPGGPPPPVRQVQIPDWGDMETADVGGDDPRTGVHTPSAQELGLVLNEVQQVMPHGTEGDIISTSPPVGTLVNVGTVVTITVLRGGDR